MKKFFLCLIFVAGAVYLGVSIDKDPGYVLLAYHQWTVEMPLWLGFLLMLFTLITGYALLRSLSYILGTSKRYRRWSTNRSYKKSQHKTQKALMAYHESCWQEAERAFITDRHKGLMHYLMAAQAAHQQQAFTKRDRYLQDAKKHYPKAELAIGLTEIKLALEEKQWASALNRLTALHRTHPTHPQILQQLAYVYEHLSDIEHLEKLLPSLEKTKALAPEQYHHVLQKVALAKLKDASKSTDSTALQNIWKQLKKNQKQDTIIIQAYTDALVSLGKIDDAAHCLESSLKQQWSDSLVTSYGNLALAAPAKALAHAESWLKKHPDNPHVLLCLGRLCLQEKLFGKAQTYLEKSLTQLPQPEAYLALGQCWELRDNTPLATRHYRDGLQAATFGVMKETNL